jgi:hypothetical protein
MIFHGAKFGVHMFDYSIRWFTDLGEAEALERIEVKKFAARDREREAARLAALGIQPDRVPIYTISLRDEQPGRTRRRLH